MEVLQADYLTKSEMEEEIATLDVSCVKLEWLR